MVRNGTVEFALSTHFRKKNAEMLGARKLFLVADRWSAFR
jgi:hypothetical protein